MREKAKNKIDSTFLKKYKKLIFVFVLPISLIFSAIYIGISWHQNYKDNVDFAINLSQAFTAHLDLEEINSLSGSEDDLEKEEYRLIKQDIERLVKTTEMIQCTYLLGQRNDDIVFLVDSTSSNSQNNFSPGQICAEATKEIKQIFTSKKTIFIDSLTDEKGTWKTVFVPVLDANEENVVALFRVDYSISRWNNQILKRMVGSIMFSILLVFFVIILMRAMHAYGEYKKINSKSELVGTLYDSIFDQVPLGIAIVNDESFVEKSKYGDRNMNFMFQKILGRTSEELTNISWNNITHPDDLEGEMALYSQFKEGKIDGYTITKRLLKPDGTYVWAQVWINRFLDKSENSSSHLLIISDITKEKEMAEDLKESERSKSLLLSNLPGMAYRYSRDSGDNWSMKFVSSGCLALTGYTAEELLEDKHLHEDLIAPGYHRILRNQWQRLIAGKRSFRHEYEIVTADGSRKWVLDLAQSVLDEDDQLQALEGIMFDITEKKIAENKLKYTYEHDDETGLLNYTSLQRDIKNDHKKQIKQAIIDVNLNTFVSLSAVFGFFYVQKLILTISESLQRFSKEKSKLYKSYGNHFIFYIKDYDDQEELIDFANKIKKSLEEIIKPERVGAGIGVVEIKVDEEVNLEDLSKKVFLTSNKAISLNESEVGILFYDSELKAQIQREEDIKRILLEVANHQESDNFYLQFQPILDLKTNNICSFEALARLKDKQLGNIPPLEFIPIAEEIKVIIPLGWNIFRQAFIFLKKAVDLGYTKVRVSINVSALQLFSNNFTQLLFDLMDEMEVPSHNVALELTESVFSSDLDEINKILNEIHNRGIYISIDDFGTGYSSLARERELNVDCLKIDRYFIKKLMDISYNEAITADIIAIGHKRGHCVIAEGVEHEKQKQYLIDNGCDKIQGYLISKPLSQKEALNLLKEKCTMN
ncbi:MAG TPA: EAL domain-containing protein [Erysipelotrichaceae bacterium]|nr:EAL domain-containing protein [Erysipelotrichaceae bacterium]